MSFLFIFMFTKVYCNGKRAEMHRSAVITFLSDRHNLNIQRFLFAGIGFGQTPAEPLT
jgi:hypothetical protein